jgi:ABC-2 type transport system ATP-binding protein
MGTYAVSIKGAYKSFDDRVVVSNISLDVRKGEIFGLLGPNGAGKTTLIRMIMDIIRPDEGTVEVFGHRVTEKDKDRIGYLPEERGLYTRQKVLSLLEYFARLKGVDNSQANRNAIAWLERLEMIEVKDKKVNELSKGNQQKIQLIATLVADPEIVVLDEPFSGLDPINRRIVTTLIHDLSNQGKTILLSTHQMDLVETLCNRVFMINRGEHVFYGELEKIRRDYSDNAYLVDASVEYSRCEMITEVVSEKGINKVFLREGVLSRDLLVWLLESGAEVRSFEQSITSLEEIFIKAVQLATEDTEISERE